jgi:hypothetical protein
VRAMLVLCRVCLHMTVSVSALTVSCVPLDVNRRDAASLEVHVTVKECAGRSGGSQACRAGRICHAGEDFAKLCPEGTHSLGVANETECRPCKEGWACPLVGSALYETAQRWVVGTYAPAGSVACIPCPAGSSAARVQSASCETCTAGEVSD